MKRLIIIRMTVIFISFFIYACNDYLDLKPRKNVSVPDRLEDLQALLDNRRTINGNGPGDLEALTDNYYTNFDEWSRLKEEDRRTYIWHPQLESLSTWKIIYQGPIYYANVVLDQLSQMRIVPGEEEQHDVIRGTALFHRAYNFFVLAQLFCEPYSESAHDLLGIPLRTTSAITAPIHRNTLAETYDRIVSDLRLAAELLPTEVPFSTRPTRAAAHAALARVYLSMRKPAEAYEFADLAVSAHGRLLDFNDLPRDEAPFKRFNIETIFFQYATANHPLLYAPDGIVDTMLYDSYAQHDLRKQLYFVRGTGANSNNFHFKCFKGDFSNDMIFTGIMSSEMYLIRAESLARLGNAEGAMRDLNTLLESRFDRNVLYVPFSADSPENALAIILAERRKELLNRGLRWMDLRRLNAEGAGIALMRKLGTETYTLPPGDPRWTLLIPEEVITRSGLTQNSR